ncbi:hypothetical protein ACK3SF_05805 [Candidatus Nanosalina sp. VS9-1]|uniref:hypothetical protein n=1 Tax=Candidatus Nanosalina sp. VS9-1 TaxID=3388566 RepID=UPI0039E16E0F
MKTVSENPDPDALDEEAARQIDSMLEDEGEVAVTLDIDDTLKHGGATTEVYDRHIFDAIEGLMNLDSVRVAFNSGKPVPYQRKLRDEWASEAPALKNIDLIGGRGTVFEINGDVFHTEDFFPDVEYSRDDFMDIQENIYGVLADEGWKGNFQNNLSWGVGVTRVEAEGTTDHSRGSTRDDPTFVNEGKTTEDIYSEHFEGLESFQYDEAYDRSVNDVEITGGPENPDDKGAIRVDDSREAYAFMTEVFRELEQFKGFRFERDDEGDIVFYRDRADIDVDESYLQSRMKAAVESANPDWGFESHSDGGFEYWHPDSGKLKGVKAYMKARNEVFGDDIRNVLHHGNGSSDYIRNPDTVIPLPVEGTDAHELASEHDYPSFDHPTKLSNTVSEAVEKY